MVAFTGNQLGIEINTSTSSANSLRSTALFRDQAWYHIVVVWDSDNTVATNRIRAWVNGERITSWGTSNFPGSAGVNSLTNSTVLNTLGAKANVSQYFDGYLAESVLIDGLALEPTSFGEYDSTGTFWTPLSSATIKGLTFGTNGFYLDNTTNAQTDASGEGNNFTNNNTVTTSTHTPSNIELLVSPIAQAGTANLPVTSNGNRTVTAASTTQVRVATNLPFPASGKWLAGVSQTEINVTGTSFGVWTDRSVSTAMPGGGTGFGGFHQTSGMYMYNTAQSAILPSPLTITTSDSFWIAVDVDAGKIFYGHYDESADTITWYAADGGTDGNPATGANPTQASLTLAGTTYAFAMQNNKAFTLIKEADIPYAIPTGYKFLNSTTLAEETTRTHSNLEEYFDTTLYEGNGAQQRVGKFLPFTNAFTVGNSGLFKLVSTSQNTSNARLTRTQDAGASVKKFSFSFWFKRGLINNTNQYIYNDEVNLYSGIVINSSNQIEIFCFTGASTLYKAATTRTITDTSQWNHVVINIDTSQSTASDRQQIYFNGVDQPLTISNQISQNNTSFTIGTAVPIAIGSFIASSGPRLPFDGYLAEFVYINNVNLAASNFGQVDTSTGRWIPKSLSGLSFDATGFYLNFATLGDDVSGNDNDFTNANVVQVGDSPTVNANNWNSAESGFSGGTFTNGNRTVQTGSSQYAPAQAGLPISSGKWYTEVVPTATSNAASFQIGITKGLTTANTQQLGSLANDVGYSGQAGNLFYNGESGSGGQSYGATYAVNDVIGMAIDFDANTITFYKNGASQGVITLPDTSTASTPYFIACNHYDNSSNGTFLLRSLSSDWTGSAPTGHLAIIQDNMPEGESYITALSWIKNRDATNYHMLEDRVRGAGSALFPNDAIAESTQPDFIHRFLAGGVQIGTDSYYSTVNNSYVAWQWYMEATGSGSALTSGSINTTALVDTNLGVSVGTYSGSGSAGTIETGLTNTQFIIVKRRDSGANWASWHVGLTDDNNVYLDVNNAQQADGLYDTSSNTSTLIAFAGGGGTQSAGGAVSAGNTVNGPQPTAGSALQGGNGGAEEAANHTAPAFNGGGTGGSEPGGYQAGGGGGGGYYGGGGGQAGNSGTVGYGGGGGSSYHNATHISSATNTSGTSSGPGYTGTNYPSGVGTAAGTTVGGHGAVWISYAITAPTGADVVLQSTDTTAEDVPTTGDLVLMIENATGTATINTDIKGYISRDSGANWTQGTLVDEGSWGTNKKILAFHNLDISGQPSGTAMCYKLETHNQGAGKITRMHATSFAWA